MLLCNCEFRLFAVEIAHRKFLESGIEKWFQKKLESVIPTFGEIDIEMIPKYGFDSKKIGPDSKFIPKFWPEMRPILGLFWYQNHWNLFGINFESNWNQIGIILESYWNQIGIRTWEVFHFSGIKMESWWWSDSKLIPTLESRYQFSNLFPFLGFPCHCQGLRIDSKKIPISESRYQFSNLFPFLGFPCHCQGLRIDSKKIPISESRYQFSNLGPGLGSPGPCIGIRREPGIENWFQNYSKKIPIFESRYQISNLFPTNNDQIHQGELELFFFKTSHMMSKRFQMWNQYPKKIPNVESRSQKDSKCGIKIPNFESPSH